MATLERTLQTFADLLAAEQPVDAGEADQAVWAYLTPVQGLTAQVHALERLRAGLAAINTQSGFAPTLRDLLDRHRARLGEGAEGHG